MHHLLAGAGAEAHAQVLERAAETADHVSLEVRDGDDGVGVERRRSDLGLGEVLAR